MNIRSPSAGLPGEIKHPAQLFLLRLNRREKLVFACVLGCQEMRASLIATMSLLGCMGLAGCDNPTNPPPAAVVQAAPPPCNCQPQSVAAVQPQAPRIVHRHRISYVSRDGYETQYSSVSQSRGESESEEQTAQQNDSNVWVDGFGRSHYAATASAAPATDEHARLAPWHGYDEKCDEKDKP